SGSANAQRLFFAHTEKGDVSKYLEAHFDLDIGGKRERASYEKIAKALELNPQQILFLSDVVEELDAAAEAGFNTVHVLRPGIESGGEHAEVTDFNQIMITQ